jgi:hypothetical protein
VRATAGPGRVQAELLEQRDRIADHVKNLYEKLGVASRQELVLRLPRRVPEVMLQTPLTSRGRFDPQ